MSIFPRSIPPLHVVTDDAVLARADFAERARAVLAAGRDRIALHLRGPATGGARLFELAAAVRSASAAAGARLLANDRVDLALAAELDGVHLRARSLPPAVARGLLPAGSLLGLSVHTAEAAGAHAHEVDYLVVGTVFATASHPDRAGGGAALVKSVRGRVEAPVIAIGGITAERVAEVVAAGAHGVAVLSGVWDADDPGEAVAGYLRRL